MNIKIEVPYGLQKYCERKGIDPKRLIEEAIEKYMFDLTYQEITA